ncbi:MAG: hypothetical protein ATN35_02015 [Epulopiscium sp. Nele67-Bin004]|nr:MAG: hypothetical protein ATN35_02015 [Epulopiscium sp. Nele67-Bin004]
MATRLADTIFIGPAYLYWYAPEASIPVNLGLTKDGVTVDYTASWHELTSDQTGKTPLDDVFLGGNVLVKCNLLNTTIERIASLFPHATQATDAVCFGSAPGLRATHYAGKLVIVPCAATNGDSSRVVTIYCTTNISNLSLAYKLDGEWIIPCEFKGYYVDSRPDGDRLFRIGSEASAIEDNDDEMYVPGEKTIKSFWITPSNPTISVGDTIRFAATAMYTDGNTNEETDRANWSLAEPSGVLIGSIFTATTSGSLLINAELAGYSCNTIITVEDA